jgi:hypothetical protein
MCKRKLKEEAPHLKGLISYIKHKCEIEKHPCWKCCWKMGRSFIEINPWIRKTKDNKYVL